MRKIASVLMLAAMAAGCAHDGRALKPAPPGATAPPTTSPTTSVPAGQPGASIGVATRFSLASPAFTPGGAMPVELTCDGTNVSPSLQWTAVPEGTVQLALTVTDPDAKGFVHWVVADLPTVANGIGPGAVPEGATEAQNGKGSTGWTGPCPPAGPPHHYVFTLYALSAPSGVVAGMSATDAILRITAAPVLSTAVLTGTYQRRG